MPFSVSFFWILSSRATPYIVTLLGIIMFGMGLTPRSTTSRRSPSARWRPASALAQHFRRVACQLLCKPYGRREYRAGGQCPLIRKQVLSGRRGLARALFVVRSMSARNCCQADCPTTFGNGETALSVIMADAPTYKCIGIFKPSNFMAAAQGEAIACGVLFRHRVARQTVACGYPSDAISRIGRRLR